MSRHHRKRKGPGWKPGQYEGKTPEEVQSQVGTAVTKTVIGTRTSDDLQWRNLVHRYDRNVTARY